MTVTWYQHAVAHAAMKWPSLAAHSRASLAEALATVTPALTGPAPGRPSATALRSALYGYAFNPARAAAADEATARVLAWTEKTSLRATWLADPLVPRSWPAPRRRSGLPGVVPVRSAAAISISSPYRSRPRS